MVERWLYARSSFDLHSTGVHDRLATGRSRTCDRGPRITRESVKGGPGTRAYSADFSVRWPTYCKSSDTVFSWGEVSYVGRMESSRTLSRCSGGVSPPRDV